MSTDRYLRPIDQFIFHNSHHHDFLVEKVIGNQPSIAIFIKPNGYQQCKDSGGTQYQHSARTILVTANNYFSSVSSIYFSGVSGVSSIWAKGWIFHFPSLDLILTFPETNCSNLIRQKEILETTLNGIIYS